ncbi:ZipA [Azoarcus sp. PA01]|nr:ZipA [Azoarcus sp. PA01]
MDSELQIGLAALGMTAVVGIIAYNKWQERKHRRQAEQAFKSEHRDVLLEPHEASPQGERVEPWTTEFPSPDANPAPAAISHPAAHAPVGRVTPGLPSAIDPRIDCVIRIESIELLHAPRLWAAQSEQLQGISKPVRWFAFDDAENLWRPLTAHSAGSFHWFCAAMQLVDRHGPIGENDFMHFSGGVQRVAEQFLAVPTDLPTRAEALRNAADLDQFCAGVDVQIGVNIVSHNQPFAGTKIRALAEASGMTIGDDGMFHARDESGHTLFTLSNMEPALFAADEMRNLTTQGLTFVIDVPRVANGVVVFDHMMQHASHMADALQGSVVDDNRAPFGPDAALLIRSQIQQFQAQMADSDVPAGSPLALRLFSA